MGTEKPMIARFRKHRTAWLLLWFICFSGPAIASPQVGPAPDTSVVRLTTHPALDIEPAVSPDGRWVAFASNRSGNFDIWVKPIHGGVAFRITSHPADDRQPRWTHDGHGVLFVSQRSDPNGDIWRIDIRRRGNVAWSYGRPRCLTPRVCYDAQPDPHPAGKVAAFVSDRSGTPGIWLLKLSNRHTHLLWPAPALWPRWSPDGRWLAWISPDTAGWSLILAAFDAAHDSLVGPVSLIPLPEGQPLSFDWNPFGAHLVCLVQPQTPPTLLAPPSPANLWVVPVPDTVRATLPAKTAAGDTLPPRLYRLSYPANQFLQLAWRHGPYVVVVASNDTTSELLRWPALGRIIKKPTSDAQLEYANRLVPIPTHLDRTADPVPAASRLWKALEALARVFDFHSPRSTRSATALYQYACAAWLAGDTSLAQQSLQRLQHLPALSEEISGAASLLRADLRAIRPGTTLLAATHIFPDSTALAVYRRLFRNPKIPVRVRAFAAFRLAQLRAQKDPHLALALFDTLAILFPLQKDLVLAARLQKAHLLAHRDSLTSQHYLFDVLAHASTYPELANEAVQILLGEKSFVPSPGEDTLGAAFRLLDTARHPEASVYIGLWLTVRALEARRLSLAKRALAQIAPLVSNHPSWTRQFSILSARVYLLEGKPGAAASVLRQALRDSLPASLAAAAYSGLADSLARAGEVRRSLQIYLEAWSYAPADPELHRKLVQTAYRAGELTRILALYKQARSRHPENPVLDYAFGLCYYYLATGPAERSGSALDIDVKNLNRSVHALELALRKNSGLVPAYLALARDYETLETALQARSQRKSAWIARTARFALAPAFFVFRTITFRKGEPKRRYYERAIDALTIALQINDERHNPKLEAELYESLAHNTYALGEYSYHQALTYYEKRLALDSTFDSANERLRFFERMGRCAFSAGKYSLAAQSFEEALSAAEQLHKQDLVPGLLTNLGTALNFAGKSAQARTVFERLLRLPRTHSSPYHRERAYRNLALAYLGAGHVDSALAYSAKALDLLASKAVPKTKRPAVRLNVAFLGWTLPVPFLDLRRYGLVPAYEGTQDLTLSEEKALVLQIQADAFFHRGDLGQALQVLSRKSAAFAKAGDRTAQSVAENNLAYLYLLAGLPEESWSHLVEAWKRAKEAADIALQIRNLEAMVALLQVRLVLYPPSTPQDIGRVKQQQAHLERLFRQTRKSLARVRVSLPSLDVRLRLAAARLQNATAAISALAPLDSTVHLVAPLALIDTLISLNQRLARLQARIDSLALPELEISTLATRTTVSQRVGDIRTSYRLLNRLRQLAESLGDTAMAARQEIRMAALLSRLKPHDRVALRAGWNPERLARRGELRLLRELLKQRWAGPADRRLLHAAVTVQVKSNLRKDNCEAALRTIRRFHTELAALLLAPFHPQDPSVERWWSRVFQQLRLRAVRASMSLEASERNRPDPLSVSSPTLSWLDSLRTRNLWLHRLAQALLAPVESQQSQPCICGWQTSDHTVWLAREGDSSKVLQMQPHRAMFDFTRHPNLWPDPLFATQTDSLIFSPNFPVAGPSPNATRWCLRANRVQPLHSFLLARPGTARMAASPGSTLASTLLRGRATAVKLALYPSDSPELVFLLHWLQTALHSTKPSD